MTNDLKLSRRLLEVLEGTPNIDAASIGVAVSGGVVTLSGAVPSAVDRIAIEQLIKRQPGVRAVANDMETHKIGVGTRTDTELAETVLTALQVQASISKDAVKVIVREGNVTVEGVVESQRQSDMASKVIHALPGITAVNNLLSFRATPPLSAEQSYSAHGSDLVSSNENEHLKTGLEDCDHSNSTTTCPP